MPELTTTAQVQIGSTATLNTAIPIYTCGDASDDGVIYGSFSAQILFFSCLVRLNQTPLTADGALGFWLQIELNGLGVSQVPLQATSSPYQVQLRGGYPTSLGLGDVIGLRLVNAPQALGNPTNPIVSGRSITATLSMYELTADPLPAPGA